MKNHAGLGFGVAMLAGLGLGFGLASHLASPLASSPRIDAAAPPPRDFQPGVLDSTVLLDLEQAHPRTRPERAATRRHPVASEKAAESVPAASELEALLHELLALGRSGVEIPMGEFVQTLVTSYLAVGEPHAALRTLERYGHEWAHLLQRVGRAFLEAGDETNAILAYRRALELDPKNPWVARSLRELDPALAAEQLRQALRTGPKRDARVIRANLADSLVALGDLSEALRVVREGLAVEGNDSRLLDLLASLDPIDAERRLQDLADESGEAYWHGELASVIAGQGRVDEASLLLLRKIASDPNDPELRGELLDRLIDIAPVHALEHLATTSREDRVNQADAERWSDLADEFRRQEDWSHAADAWCRAILTEADDPDSHVDQLRRYAPERLIPVLEQRVRLNEHDEALGSLGDAYWHAERHQEAKTAWARALELDPTDDEWIAKNAAVRAGRNPLEAY
jgi:tetratricopeptide (TPR) repeat protein